MRTNHFTQPLIAARDFLLLPHQSGNTPTQKLSTGYYFGN